MFQYKVKIHPDKSPVFIWGSKEVEKIFSGSLTLLIRNDEVGEPVVIHTVDGSSNPLKEVVQLQPGELYAVQLGIDSLKGVVASCKEDNVDSKVECTIISPASSN